MDRILSYTLREEDLPSTAGGLVNLILKDRIRVTGHEISHAKFTENGITADGLKVTVKDRIRPGQTLTVVLADLPEEEEKVVPADPPFPLEILYEDEDLIAVNKPSGTAVHPNHGHYLDTMANYLARYYEEKGLAAVIRIAGRLDRDTSGVLVFAKNRACAGRLAAQRKNGIFRRTYTALVHGNFPEERREGIIDLPIEKVPDALLLQRPAKDPGDGKKAVTQYCVTAQKSDTPLGPAALVSFTLETGRTHQIRVHMSATGHPLFGDPLYGNGEYPGRALLHAGRCRLIQPFTGKEILLQAPEPADFSEIKEKLGLS